MFMVTSVQGSEYLYEVLCDTFDSRPDTSNDMDSGVTGVGGTVG